MASRGSPRDGNAKTINNETPRSLGRLSADIAAMRTISRSTRLYIANLELKLRLARNSIDAIERRIRAAARALEAHSQAAPTAAERPPLRARPRIGLPLARRFGAMNLNPVLPGRRCQVFPPAPRRSYFP